MWQFLKRSPVTSVIVAAVVLLGIVGVLYAVITKAGDDGFKRIDGKVLRWDKRDLPLVCFYKSNVPDALVEAYSIAASTINDAVGESLLRACSPWLLESKAMPLMPGPGIVYLENVIEGLPVDGMTVEAENDPETGGRTVMVYDKRTGIMRSAIVQIGHNLHGKDAAVFLHELGHVLGLGHDRLKDSIMYENLSGRPGGLTQKDAKLLKKAYGGIGK